jgi:hypothetical protein
VHPVTINSVGEIKVMFEKLLLAVTITFSLNLFLQVRLPNQAESGTKYQQADETAPAVLVRLADKYKSN